jgi:hypothetical protein
VFINDRFYGINEYMKGRTGGQLYGVKITLNNIKKLKPTDIVNKRVYLRNLRARLSNVSLNRLMNEVVKIKKNLPSNVHVSKSDVNELFSNMKKEIILNKIYNKPKHSALNNRVRIMNTMKNKGLINKNDIGILKNKLTKNNSPLKRKIRNFSPNRSVGKK